MRPFEPTIPMYYQPEEGKPPRRIEVRPMRYIHRSVKTSWPLSWVELIVAALAVAICATLVILAT